MELSKGFFIVLVIILIGFYSISLFTNEYDDDVNIDKNKKTSFSKSLINGARDGAIRGCLSGYLSGGIPGALTSGATWGVINGVMTGVNKCVHL